MSLARRSPEEERISRFAEAIDAARRGVRPASSWDSERCFAWSIHKRPEQDWPEARGEPADYFIELSRTGRGFGKTWKLSGLLVDAVKRGRSKVAAVIAPTQADVRAVNVEHPKVGILAMAEAEGVECRWWSSKAEIEFPDHGAIVYCYSAEKRGKLRGKQHDFAICDELREWSGGSEAFDNLLRGMRLGEHPRIMCATTPPRAGESPDMLRFLRDLEERDGTVVVTGSSQENLENLSPTYYALAIEPYLGTSLGRVEVDGEYEEQSEAALWTRVGVEESRVSAAPDLARVVVGVDPHGGADLCGISVCGLGEDDRLYVLADYSTKEGSTWPGWPARVVRAFERYEADRVVAETNFGGDMVESVMRVAAAHLPVTVVSASRSKRVRAEPIAALWERGQASVVGSLPELEDELCTWSPVSKHSPNRLDAMVWAASDLMLGSRLLISRVDEADGDNEEAWS